MTTSEYLGYGTQMLSDLGVLGFLPAILILALAIYAVKEVTKK